MQVRSARLVFEPIAPADVDALHAIFVDPQVRRYLFDDVLVTRERAAEIVEQSARWFRDHGFGLWTIRVQEQPDVVVGFCGFWPTIWPDEIPGTPELIYALAPSVWRRGYATEAARRLADWIFETLAPAQILAATDVPNTPSVAVLVRLGMSFDRRGTLNGLDTYFYRLARPR